MGRRVDSQLPDQPPGFPNGDLGVGPVFTASRTGFLSGVEEDARGRYFDLGPGGPLLPRRIYYRFDHDNLVLDIPEGPVRGLHTLVREGEAAPSHTAWVIGAVILGLVVLVAAVILFRSRTRKAAEPGAFSRRRGHVGFSGRVAHSAPAPAERVVRRA